MAADEVWEGGWAALAAAVRSDDGEEPYHPELVMWVVAGDGFVLGDALVGPGGGAAALVDLLSKVMSRPAVGEPRRPSAVRVGDPEVAQRLQAVLAPLGVAVESSERLDDWKAAFDHVDTQVSPSVGGYHPTTPEHGEALALLFRAAAAFYRAEPWQGLNDWRPLSLDTPMLPGHAIGMIVIGERGENRGLIVFASLEIMADFYDVVTEVGLEAVDPADLPPTISLNYGTADEMPDEAVEEAGTHGWELAAPDAYPLVLATEPGEGFVLDLSPEPLSLLTLATQAVTQFWLDAQDELRAGKPLVVREVEVELAGAQYPVRVACPPILPGRRRRTRKPARGPRSR
jgi:hypothetical protein